MLSQWDFYIRQPLTKEQIFTCFLCIYYQPNLWLGGLGHLASHLIFYLSNFSKFFNFSAIFVPVPFCEFLQIWSSFLSIQLASKYLQPNFEIQGVLRSLSTALIPTVLLEGLFLYYQFVFLKLLICFAFLITAHLVISYTLFESTCLFPA